MRMTRVQIFKRSRHKRVRKLILFALIIPAATIIMGYLISTVFILPLIAGK